MLRTTTFRSRTPGRAAMALPMLTGFAIAASAQAAPATTYTVKSGDTLWQIARTQLGDPHRWSELHRTNQGIVSDPNRISPGIVLQLGSPGSASSPAEPGAAPPSPATPHLAPTPAPTSPSSEAQPEPAVAQMVEDTIPRPGSVETGEGDPATALFRRGRVVSAQTALRAYRESKFRPLRAGEVFSSGFLTEGEDLPIGTLLGPGNARLLASPSERAIQPFTQVSLVPPNGATYAAGDTMLVADRREGPSGFGEVIAPSGLVRVVRQDEGRALGEVIAVYGTIRGGQAVLPIPAYRDPGPVEYQQVATGVEGQVLAPRDRGEIRLPQQVLFLDVGKRDGVTPGDLFEARRTSADPPTATLQVVQVRERSATVRVLKLTSPSLPPGTRVRQVARIAGSE